MSSACEPGSPLARERASLLERRGGSRRRESIHHARMCCVHARQKEDAGRPAEECFREAVCSGGSEQWGILRGGGGGGVWDGRRTQ